LLSAGRKFCPIPIRFEGVVSFQRLLPFEFRELGVRLVVVPLVLKGVFAVLGKPSGISLSIGFCFIHLGVGLLLSVWK
jgi:hypothetical protein